ncbi:hypothetical protein MYSTI_05773 [Myxococcus stipitatus DSM 14675]|uniref:Lipoprotein n=1 Tax=Myxococcus stipitatus (strain DSM 14675 / JCM 12634 / Mx s8) TaxID=1278073 RepID=L7UKS9_MYXSD|nr:hypothetical protein [Myxococcus stipitatus]AGC47049.1 hypothetical protein MYSTI_05773 [Myxococcus stipitatus DSM 14675]
MQSRTRFLLLSLSLLAAIPFQASAQTEEGPFYSTQHLTSYWQNRNTNSATEISLNAWVVLTKPGFGPALRLMYFKCMDGLIRQHCNQVQGPFVHRWEVEDFLNSGPGAGSIVAYLDGNRFLNGFGPLFGTYYYYTCVGGPSQHLVGRMKYIMLQSADTIYGPIAGQSCLPAP